MSQYRAYFTPGGMDPFGLFDEPTWWWPGDWPQIITESIFGNEEERSNLMFGHGREDQNRLAADIANNENRISNPDRFMNNTRRPTPLAEESMRQLAETAVNHNAGAGFSVAPTGGIPAGGVRTRPGGVRTRPGGVRNNGLSCPAPKRRVSLGIEDHLDDFTRKNGAESWKQWAKSDPAKWKSKFYEQLNDPNAEVIFNLDGVDVWKGVSRSSRNAGGATDWELLQIRSNPEWWSRIKWIKDGVEVANPFK